MCFGFEHGDGWYQLLYNLCRELMSTGDEPPVAMQVKEKFGTLRFYVVSATTQQHDIIEHYEQLSAKTCEVCGHPGVIRGGGWMRTLCDEHSQGELPFDFKEFP